MSGREEKKTRARDKTRIFMKVESQDEKSVCRSKVNFFLQLLCRPGSLNWLPDWIPQHDHGTDSNICVGRQTDRRKVGGQDMNGILLCPIPISNSDPHVMWNTFLCCCRW